MSPSSTSLGVHNGRLTDKRVRKGGYAHVPTYDSDGARGSKAFGIASRVLPPKTLQLVDKETQHAHRRETRKGLVQSRYMLSSRTQNRGSEVIHPTNPWMLSGDFGDIMDPVHRLEK